MEDVCGRKRGAVHVRALLSQIKVAPIITSEELGRAQRPSLIVPAKSRLLFDIVAAG